jgi:hypothetical protein
MAIILFFYYDRVKKYEKRRGGQYEKKHGCLG